MSTSYPSDWDSRRKQVYKRDNYTCQNCGRQGGPRGSVELHAHHVVPKSKGGTHNPSNLITVCSNCHNAIHNETQAPTSDSLNIDQKGRLGSTSSENGIQKLIDAEPREYGKSNLYRHRNFVQTYNISLSILQNSIKFYYLYCKFYDQKERANKKDEIDTIVDYFDNRYSILKQQVRRLRKVDRTNFSDGLCSDIDAFLIELEVIEEWEESTAKLIEVHYGFDRENNHTFGIKTKSTVRNEVQNILTIGSEIMDDIKREERNQSKILLENRDVDMTSLIDVLDDCPFCGNNLDQIRDEILQCHSCHAEFLGEGGRWKLINGEERFVGRSMLPKLWKHISDGEINHSAKELEQISDSIRMTKAYGLLFGMILSISGFVLFSVGWGTFIGYVFYLGAILFVVGLIIVVGTFYVNKRQMPS